jgi:hypothetical protein
MDLPLRQHAISMLGTLPLTAASSSAQQGERTAAGAAQGCTGDNGGITLPTGFCATVFADNVGHARQMVVAPNGVLYVNTWSGAYCRNDTPPAGGFLVVLQDTTGPVALMWSLGLARVLRAAMRAEPGSRSTTERSMQKRTIELFAMPCRRAPLCQADHRR